MSEPGAPPAAGQLPTGAEEVPPGGLAERLAQGSPRALVRLGAAAPALHLGHAALLRKLAELRDRGAAPVLVLGDYSAQLTGLDAAAAAANAERREREALALIGREGVEVRRDSEWLDMPMARLFDLARAATVDDVVRHGDFAERLESGAPITVLELIGPLLAASDAVAVGADVLVAGADRAAELALARAIQQAGGEPAAVTLALPLLPGTDGASPMSGRAGSAIGVADDPADMFGKLMRVPDEAMPAYYGLLLGEPLDHRRAAVEAKRALARSVVARYRSDEAARQAEERFDRIHVAHAAPDDVEQAPLPAGERIHLPALIGDHFGMSRSEARRLLAQGGVRVDGRAAGADELDVPRQRLEGAVVQVGKRRFKRFVATAESASG